MIVERFLERYEQIIPNASSFCDACTEPLPKAFRINTLKAEKNQVVNRFFDYGIELTPVSFYENAFISSEPNIGNTLEHFFGAIYVQELVSMLPPILVRKELVNVDKVLDGCAAPGSKTTEIAEFMNNENLLVANDIEYKRIKALKSNLERCGVYNTIITNKNLLHFKNNVKFDIVFLDAPCSSEGTLRKNPEIAYLWDERKILGYSKLQKSLILKSYDLLEAGGILIYSTCTFAPEENEEVIDHLINNRDAKIEPISIAFNYSSGVVEWKGKEYSEEVKKAARIWPHQNNSGGFFLTKIRKES